MAGEPEAPPSVETFQTSLAPYGDWVVVGSYGRVWRPHVAAGWRPYYYGRWEWTNEGWLWVSDEPFGWAAYHYGRWALDPAYGWVWVPGYEWAPAWVSWRYSGDVVGWAPLGPGVSVYVATTPYAEAWWTFVPCRSFVAEPVYRVAYEPARTRRYFFDTAPAPARPGFRPGPGRPAAPAWGGPPPRAIEERIGRPITPVRVVAAPAPGRGAVRPGEVSVFRPGVRPGAPVLRPAPSAPPRAVTPDRGFPPRGFGSRAAEPGSSRPERTYAPPAPRETVRPRVSEQPRTFEPRTSEPPRTLERPRVSEPPRPQAPRAARPPQVGRQDGERGRHR